MRKISMIWKILFSKKAYVIEIPPNNSVEIKGATGSGGEIKIESRIGGGNPLFIGAGGGGAGSLMSCIKCGKSQFIGDDRLNVASSICLICEKNNA